MALTLKDLEAIREIIKITVSPRFEAIEESISFLPTKEEFYSKMDLLTSEIKEYRQERAILLNRVNSIEERFNKAA